jgi:hypothetical protein
MSYFQRCAEYYIASLNLSGPENRRIIGERCRAKYPRGVNLVAVSNRDIGIAFTPEFFVDPGRIFLTLERLMKEALNPNPDESESFYKELKTLVETYDPFVEILFLILRVGGLDHEAFVYRVKI